MSLHVHVALLIAAVAHCSLADVKHVLEGSAQPPQHVHTYECQYPNIPGYPAAFPNNADINAQFIQAYEFFKKCAEKANCLPPVAPWPQVPNTGCNPAGCVAASSHTLQVKDETDTSEQKFIDISKNPFLNGQIPTLPQSSCTGPKCNSAGGQIDISNNPFLNGNIQINNKPQNPQGCGSSGCSTGNVPTPSYNNNPFLNGGGCGGAGCKPINSITPEPPKKPDFSKNPFLTGGSGQTAFSNSGQAIETGFNGFLGVQPSIPFEKIDFKPKPFPTNYPNSEPIQNIQPLPSDDQFTSNGKPFPISYPGKSEEAAVGQKCNGHNHVCVVPELCINGYVLTDGTGILDRRHSDDHCENEKVCCRVLEDTPSSVKGSKSTKFSSDSSSIYVSSTSNILPSKSYAKPFPNIIDINNGKKAAPGSVIKFNGGDGISPGSIQVISDNEAIPNPQVSNSGESGSGIVHSAASDIPVFSSTPDYSNNDLSQISFISTTRGPQYLPPDASPKPHIDIPELVAPAISTYEPLIPIAPKPVTKPVLPGPSVVSVHPHPTPGPFVPSSPQPFIPIEPVPHYPHIPTPFEILPQLPSSPKPFFPQPPVNIIPFPSQPIYEPIKPQEPVILPLPPTFVEPEPEVIQIHEPSIPLVTLEDRIKPIVPHVPDVPKITPGYKYPTPSPPFNYPSPSTPKPSFSFNDNYVPIKTKPTLKPYRPQPQPSGGYEYKKPTPSFPVPTPKPFNPQPQPSVGYEYRKPTPSFPTPPPVIKVTNNEYLPPFETPKPYNPQPQPSDEFEFLKTPPSIPPTKNQYLPPFKPSPPNRVPEGSNTNEFFVSKPSAPSTTYNPNHEGQPDVPVPGIIKLPKPQQPSPPQAGCAAALKCVQEIYCTAEGVISPVPVILTNAQQLLRVPTTECVDREAGIVGRCCRDPNYVDPWPSANSLNGVDDGQYKEDPNLGKYFPNRDQGSQQSEIRPNVVKAPRYGRYSGPVNSEVFKNNTWGVRHFNSQPRGTGPLEAAFGEIPWQAMILRDTTRKLLCGGVIVKPNAVATSAQCVDGLPSNDILIKGGEWKLGIDEEPLPFQIVRVAAIIRHPNYKPGVLQNDLALLILEEDLRIAKNIAPIVLSNIIEPQKQQCIVTGWGKRILQAHLKGAIMKTIDVNILGNQQCREVIQERYTNSIPKLFQNTICGFSKNDQCDVDYGSALACSSGNGIYTLAGIFSWDTGCKDDAQIGGYIPPDVEWIENTCSKPLTQLKAIDRKYNNQY